jgi:hypothetical protein
MRRKKINQLSGALIDDERLLARDGLCRVRSQKTSLALGRELLESHLAGEFAV